MTTFRWELKRRQYVFALKLGTLLSFCGGPMVVADLLKPQWGPKLAFAAAFMPVGLMLFGALCLNETDGFARLCVAAGIPGASLLIPVNAYAVWNLIQIPGRADQGLISVGAVVGTLVAFAYIGQAREFLRRPNSE